MEAEKKSKDKKRTETAENIKCAAGAKCEVNKKYVETKDGMKEISVHLESLYGLITTVCMGLQTEYVERQAIECLECIAQYVWDMKMMADEYCGI